MWLSALRLVCTSAATRSEILRVVRSSQAAMRATASRGRLACCARALAAGPASANALAAGVCGASGGSAPGRQGWAGRRSCGHRWRAGSRARRAGGRARCRRRGASTVVAVVDAHAAVVPQGSSMRAGVAAWATCAAASAMQGAGSVPCRRSRRPRQKVGRGDVCRLDGLERLGRADFRGGWGRLLRSGRALGHDRRHRCGGVVQPVGALAGHAPLGHAQAAEHAFEQVADALGGQFELFGHLGNGDALANRASLDQFGDAVAAIFGRQRVRLFWRAWCGSPRGRAGPQAIAENGGVSMCCSSSRGVEVFPAAVLHRQAGGPCASQGAGSPARWMCAVLIAPPLRRASIAAQKSASAPPTSASRSPSWGLLAGVAGGCWARARRSWARRSWLHLGGGRGGVAHRGGVVVGAAPQCAVASIWSASWRTAARQGRPRPGRPGW